MNAVLAAVGITVAIASVAGLVNGTWLHLIRTGGQS